VEALSGVSVNWGNYNVNVLIRAKDQASRVVRDIAEQVQGSASRMRRAFEGLKDVGKIAAGMLVRDMVMGATRAYSETVQLGGQIDTLKASFDRLVASTGDTTLTLEKLRQATKGTVSDVDLLQAANMALMLDIPATDEEMANLFNAAMKLGHAMGIDTTKAIESLTIGLGRQSKLVLDNLGITFEASEAYEWFAQQLGVSADQLTENEKRLAWQKYAIMKITEKAGELGDVVSDAQLANERWGASIENLKAGIGRMLGPLGMVAPAITPLMPLIGTLAGTAIPQLIASAGGISAAFGAAKGALLGVMGAMGPVGWAIMGLVAVGSVLYMAWTQNWFGIQEKVGGAVEAIKSAVGGFVKWIANAWKGVTDFLGWVWDSLWTGIANFVSDPIGSIKSAVQGLAQNMAQRFQEVHDQTGNKWRATWEAIKTIPVLGQILATVEGLADSILGVFGLSMDDVFNAWQGAWNAISGFLSDPIGSIQRAVGGLLDSVKARFEKAYEETGDVWTATWEALKAIPGLNLILQAVEGVWNSINDIMGGWPGKALEWGKKLVTSFVDGIKKAVEGVVDAVKGVGEAIANFLGIGSPAKMGPLSKLDLWGPGLVETYAEGIRGAVPELRRAVEYAAQQVSFSASPEFAPVIGEIEAHHVPAGFGPAPEPAKIIQISGPLVYIEGSADEATAKLASELVLRELSKIVGV
jgi:phage-related protein